VLDQNNCLDTVHIQIDSTAIQASVDTVQNVRCFEGNNGSISLTVSAGTAPYNYIWSTATIGNTPSATGLIAGNYSVTITDANLCTTSITAFIDQPAELTAQLTGVDVKCFGDADGFIQIESTSGGTAPYQYALGQSAFTGNSFFEDLNPGTYIVHVQDANTCLFSDTLLLSEPAFNLLQAGPDTTIFQGEQITLSGIVTDPGSIVQYNWKPADRLGCDTCLNTIAQPAVTTVFTFCTTDSSGCMDQASTQIRVEPAPLYIPNAIAPASNLSNDRFTVYAGAQVQAVDLLQVYDRWGNLVFENRNFQASDPLQGWGGDFQGKDAAPGVYVYVLKLRLIDGSTTFHSGDILVVR
jgi:hypothetical protein